MNSNEKRNPIFGYSGPQPPCTITCKGRTSICHTTCEKWKNYEKKRFAYLDEEINKKKGRPDFKKNYGQL